MGIVLAILAGFFAGIIGALPYIFVARSARKVMAVKDGLIMMRGMVALFISSLILVACMVLCYLLATDYLLFFTLTAILVFLLCVIVYTAALAKLGKQDKA